MLCPKGVKRYLQSNHPDRLLDPLLRTDQRLCESKLGRGHELILPGVLRRVQERYGKDAVAVYVVAA